MPSPAPCPRKLLRFVEISLQIKYVSHYCDQVFMRKERKHWRRKGFILSHSWRVQYIMPKKAQRLQHKVNGDITANVRKQTDTSPDALIISPFFSLGSQFLKWEAHI